MTFVTSLAVTPVPYGPEVAGRVMLAIGLVALVAGCATDEAADAPSPVEEARPTIPTSEVAPPTPPGADDRATVVEVIDGDTLEVRLAGGRVERLRLVGINTPEDGECLADEAATRLRELLHRPSVRLERDQSDRDQYDRLLRHVIVDGRSVGEVLVAEGLALSRAYPPDTGRQATLDAAQAQAEAAGLGLWSPDACGPASSGGRRARCGAGRPARRRVPDAERGVDRGRQHRCATRGPHRVGGDGTRAPRTASASRTGSGWPRGPPFASTPVVAADTSSHLYWCVTGSAVWNNDGDTAFLTDPSGNVNDQRDV